MKKIILDKLPPSVTLNLKWWKRKALNRQDYKTAQQKRKFIDDADYTFKSFDDTRSIFVHVPKCAGVSVCRALYGNLAGGHMTLAGYTDIFEPSALKKYFKFTFVRNPYDRRVSAFFFLKQGGMHDADKEWFVNELGTYDSFHDFVHGWVESKNIWKYWHFRPQHHFIIDPRGLVELDFIGRFENLEEDFEHIAQRLGSSAVLPRSNNSSRDSYLNYYDEHTKRIVANVYYRDFELFGYDIDGSAKSF